MKSAHRKSQSSAVRYNQISACLKKPRPPSSTPPSPGKPQIKGFQPSHPSSYAWSQAASPLPSALLPQHGHAQPLPALGGPNRDGHRRLSPVRGWGRWDGGGGGAEGLMEGVEGFLSPAAKKRGREGGGQSGSTNHASPVSRLTCHQPCKSAVRGSEKAGKSRRAGFFTLLTAPLSPGSAVPPGGPCPGAGPCRAVRAARRRRRRALVCAK